MEIEDIKHKSEPVLRRGGVTRASLFGSFARGQATSTSDVDILVELPLGKSLFDFIGLKLELEDVLGKKVDLVEYKTIKPDLKSYILKDQIILI